MSKVTPFPPSGPRADATADPRAQKIVEAIRLLLAALPVPDQERVLREITAAIRPIDTPRAGEVLGAIVRLLPKRDEWTVDDIKKQVAEEGVQARPKEIHNALGYLARKGHVRRLGYGRYLFGGMEIVTSDDLGGEPARNEGED